MDDNSKDPAFEHKRFRMIFWFLVGCVIVAFGYNFAITFCNIPAKGVRFADTAQGFFLGTVIGGAFGYLITNSAAMTSGKGKPNVTVNQTADNATTIAGNSDATTNDTTKKEN